MSPLIPVETIVERAFDVIESVDSVENVVSDLRTLLGVDHVVYNCSGSGSDPTVRPYVKMTYPSDWIKRYVLMDYANVDPVLKRGFSSALAFDWSEIVVKSAQEQAMLRDAIGHGIGPHGLSIPVTSRLGHRGLFSVSHAGDGEDWRRYRADNIKGLVDIANRIHRRVLQQEFGETRAHLTVREVECLSWSAQGKEAADIAGILDISVHTVRDYLKSARFKLDCVNVAQAVSKAIAHGLISV